MFRLASQRQQAIESCARDPKVKPNSQAPQGNPVANPPPQHPGQQVQPDP